MPSNKKIVFGFTGLPASGKGEAAKYFENQHGAKTFRFSTMLRDLLGRVYLEHSRDNMIKMSEAVRGKFGEDIMARVIAEDVSKENVELIVVEGIRRMADIEYLKRLPNFVLVEIFADMDKRLERIQKRGENPDDATKTMEQFKADHARSTEITIPEVVGQAKEHVDNNGSVQDLRANLDSLLKKYAA